MKIGTRVKFKKIGYINTIPDFDSNIPSKLLKHGSTVVGSEYHKKGAIIKGENEELYYVEYISEQDKPVCLGFKKELVEIFSWRYKYEKRN